MSTDTLNLVPSPCWNYDQTVLRELIDDDDWKEYINISILSIDFIRQFKDKIRWDWQYYALLYLWKHKDDDDLFANKKNIETFFKEFKDEIESCEEMYGRKIR